MRRRCWGGGGGVTPGLHFPGCGSGHVSSAGGPSEPSVHSLPGVSGGDSPQALLTQLPFRVLLPRNKGGKGRASGGPPGMKMERKCSLTFPPGPEGSVLKPHVRGGGCRAHCSPQSGNSTDRTRMRLREPGGEGRRAQEDGGQDKGSGAALHGGLRSAWHRALGQAPHARVLLADRPPSQSRTGSPRALAAPATSARCH